MSEKDVLILAIESSCDETAASVVKNGRTILSNVILLKDFLNQRPAFFQLRQSVRVR